MAALATVAALEARLGMTPGTLQGVDRARAEASLDDASELVRAEAGKGWTDVTVPASVKPVVLRAALRDYRNPEGYSSESIGDYSYQLSREVALGVYLTDAERRLVRQAAGRAAYSVGTVRTPSAYFDPVEEGGSSWA